VDKDYLLAVLKKFKRIERDLESRISRSLIGGHQPKPFIGFEEYLSNRKGRALISYLSAPFHISKDSSEMYSHQNYCRALEIAKVFNALEYTVDVVDLYDHTFKPRYRYDILCGNGTNFKRLAKILDKEVLKIFFTPDPHPDFRRAAEKERRNDIIKRRGIELTLRYPSVIEFPEKYIDAVICTGNSWVASNYLSFNDNVYAIGDGGFDFLQSTLVGKDFNSARKRFIWMASWLLGMSRMLLMRTRRNFFTQKTFILLGKWILLRLNLRSLHINVHILSFRHLEIQQPEVFGLPCDVELCL